MIYILFKIFFWIVIIGSVILYPILHKAYKKFLDDPYIWHSGLPWKLF